MRSADRRENHNETLSQGTRHDVRALVGGYLFCVGVGRLIVAPYGVVFLGARSSVYPGFHASRTMAGVLAGTLDGLVDGAIGSLLFGWLYNASCHRSAGTRNASGGRTFDPQLMCAKLGSCGVLQRAREVIWSPYITRQATFRRGLLLRATTLEH